MERGGLKEIERSDTDRRRNVERVRAWSAQPDVASDIAAIAAEAALV